MKYFNKLAYLGIPKSDIERVMTHYKISRDEAVKKIESAGSIEKLLPQRGFQNRR